MHTKHPERKDARASYIVRLLYRRRSRDEQLVGVVESVEDGARHAFTSRDELWAILMCSDVDLAGETKPDRMLDK